MTPDEPAATGQPSPESVISGSSRMFAAQLLFPVSALAVAALLSRGYGPDGYGLITLAVVTVAWIEWSVVTVLGRASVKFVREAEDWEAVATTVVRAHVLAGLVATALLVLLAGPVADLLGNAGLAPHLRVLALDVPLFLAARAHQLVLAGRGWHRGRAVATAARWIARLVLVAIAVALFSSPLAALAAMVAGSLVELAVSRRYVAPPVLRPSGFALMSMAAYVLPLGVHGICLRLFDRADIYMLTALGGSAADAGRYGAAQNLALLATLFGMAGAPVVLSELTARWAGPSREDGDALARRVLEHVLLVAPVMALVAGAAPGLVAWVYGPSFEAAGPLLSVLAFAGAAQTVAGVATMVLVAGSEPRLCLAVGPVMLTVALAGHALFIPVGGAAAAALVTTTSSALGVCVTYALVAWRRRTWPRASYTLRVALLTVASYAGAAWWGPQAWMAALALAAGCVALLGAAVAMGLLRADQVRSALAAVTAGSRARR